MALDAISTRDAVKLLADGLALVYHEARHVRHLVKAGFLPASGWERLLSLPTNRVKAWQAIQDVRKNAADSKTPLQATRQFEQRYSRNLTNVHELYANKNWKHAKAVGGHAWRGVAAAVGVLQDAIVRGDISEIDQAAQSLVAARHNNGALRDKIRELDAAIGIQSGWWWLEGEST